MIWRSTIVAGYMLLAIVVGIAYGGRGLAILFFFYFWATAWLVFVLVWGWAARTAGRWNVRRLESAPVRRERTGSRPGEGDAEAGVEHDAAPATDVARRQPVPVL